MSKFTAVELVELANGVYEGAELEYLTESGWTVLGTKAETVDALLHSWRIKPGSKIIDMAHLVKSGMDCEFSDDETWRMLAGLVEVDLGCKHPYTNIIGVRWKHCRPRMNHKMYHDGGECPLPEGFKVRLMFRDGAAVVTHTYSDLKWLSTGFKVFTHADIIGYEILGLADGWAYPYLESGE